MKPFYSIIVLAICLMHSNSYAQMQVSENASTKNVTIHADPRLDLLLEKHRNVQLGVIRQGRGYRVQIYYGNDRSKASQIKVDFMRRYPDVRATLSYIHPQYRVKVGDFATRKDAWEFYREIDNIFSPCMVVPDKVIINTLNND